MSIAELTLRKGKLSDDEWLISINLPSAEKLINDKNHVLNIDSNNSELLPSQLFKIFQFIKMEIGSKIWVGQKMFITCPDTKLAIAAGYFINEIYGIKKFEQPILFQEDISVIPDQLRKAIDMALHTYFWLETFNETWTEVPF